MYGVSEGTWYSLGDLIFTQDTNRPINMLAGPIHLLITRIFLWGLWQYWWRPTLYIHYVDESKKTNAAQTAPEKGSSSTEGPSA